MKIFGETPSSSKPCPLCGKQGRPVSGITVKHLVKEDFKDLAMAEASYIVCMNEVCDVVYYEALGTLCFTKAQVVVPIWFKKDADPKYACYCSRVTVEEVIHAVVYHDATTVKEVNQLTGAMKNANCKLNNPLGVCCHPVIQEAILKGLAIKRGEIE